MTTDTKAFDPAAEGWAPVEDSGFIAHVGPLYIRAADGAYAFRAEQKHANLIGVVHGGMVMSFADRALGQTAMRAADGANCVTIQLEMKFIDVGRLGDWIAICPQVVKRTGSMVFMRGDVRDGERLVASADGVWKILRRRPG
ncbi:PaaI family thioesterase [Methylobacterium sp. NEAU K]|uniref:PaaI family thioesterase n=1 Tax=Methylobacterium sp. NEAU K TaxID=3064946 RepID=UPI0027370E7C|nr:PaaI family thioesterase [Methylobacterium sp. NEAU K]MDP4002581.1 PaaI family thioesterase [Methylobacterium sp. NEAU K]